MEDERIAAVLYLHKTNERIDIDIPLDITANELITGLTCGFNLGIDTSDMSLCFLRTENPIAFMRGNKTLREYGLRNGTVINIM